MQIFIMLEVTEAWQGFYFGAGCMSDSSLTNRVENLTAHP